MPACNYCFNEKVLLLKISDSLNDLKLKLPYLIETIYKQNNSSGLKLRFQHLSIQWLALFNQKVNQSFAY